MKGNRHQKIIELVDNYNIETQEELAERLKEEGYQVTKATVSRDIRALKLSKVSCGIYTFVLWELLKNADKALILVGLEKARKYYECSEVIHHFSKLFSIQKNVKKQKIKRH